MSIKRVVVGAAAALAALALAAPVSANVKAVCAVDGAAKFTDKDDPAYGERLVGGSGKFEFRSNNVECVGNAKGTPFIESFDMDVSGWYVSEVCGTGKAVGTVTAATGSGKVAAAVVGKKIKIVLRGWTGEWYWHNWGKLISPPKAPPPLEDPAPNEKDPQPLDDKDWRYGGPAKRVPPPPNEKPVVVPGPVDNCTKAAHLDAVVTVDDTPTRTE